jgi:hypothetical protein
MLKQIALQIPRIRRLYEERERLIAKRKALLSKCDGWASKNAKLLSRIQEISDRTEAMSRPQELSLLIDCVDHTHPYSRAVETALETALACAGALSPDVLAIEGMSGRKYRRFINALVAQMPDARYLEVGVHKGSTACAAVYGNAVTATLIDNWSQFGGDQARFEFNRNIASVVSPDTKLKLIEQDFRAVVPASLGAHNVYLFDGPHSEADQYEGITLMQPALDDAHVLIVDDWNWPEVRAGTLSAITNLKSTLSLRLEIRTTADDSHPLIGTNHSDWHNGYFVACVRKQTSG